MGLTKYNIGRLVKPYNRACGMPHLSEDDVSGINREKEFFEPARQVGADTRKYLVVPSGCFACNLMHVGRDCVLPIAFNRTSEEKIVSPAYSVFSILDDAPIIDEYFFMLVNSIEKDRYFWLHSDSSVRDGLPWDAFCEIEFNLPPLPIQKKYVDIYNAMIANQQNNERSLEDLKLVCDAYIEELRRKISGKKIGNYIELVETKNDDLRYSLDNVKGISIEKRFIETKANMKGVNLAPYYVVSPNDFAYGPVTSRNGDKISLALNDSSDFYICSSSYIAFKIKDTNALDPKYLMMFLSQPRFDRYARFNSWGSVRETFEWVDMCDVEIPIPDIKTQRAIADIYTVYKKRKELNEQLKSQIKNICPILIKGSLEEGKQGS